MLHASHGAHLGWGSSFLRARELSGDLKFECTATFRPCMCPALYFVRLTCFKGRLTVPPLPGGGRGRRANKGRITDRPRQSHLHIVRPTNIHIRLLPRLNTAPTHANRDAPGCLFRESPYAELRGGVAELQHGAQKKRASRLAPRRPGTQLLRTLEREAHGHTDVTSELPKVRLVILAIDSNTIGIKR